MLDRLLLENENNPEAADTYLSQNYCSEDII